MITKRFCLSVFIRTKIPAFSKSADAAWLRCSGKAGNGIQEKGTSRAVKNKEKKRQRLPRRGELN